ncbi:MAG: hypothetical protein PVG42_14530 [Lysobacterales bacterium]|jgi:hypothetical protein
MINANRFYRTIAAFAVFCLGTSLLSAAQADSKDVAGSSSGTFERSFNSTNGGGGWALSSTFTGSDNIGGQFTGRQLMAFNFTLANNVCPTGEEPFTLEPISGDYATANTVLSYNKGQVYLLTTEASGCMDFVTGEYVVDTVATITGGTGKFAAATGEISSAVNGRVLLAPTWYGSKGQFGAFESTHAGSVEY